MALLHFRNFEAEGEIVGRLLTGYANLEVGLLHCVSIAPGNNFNATLKTMFGKRGESRRIAEAEKLGRSAYAALGLGFQFQRAIKVLRNCLDIRSQYAHWVWWDDNTGKLAFANIEHIAKFKSKITGFDKLKAHHVDTVLLNSQEAYFLYADRLLGWINHEGRTRSGLLRTNVLKKPRPLKKPRLRLP